MHPVLPSLLALVILAGCATPGLLPGQASLTLHETLVIPANAASVRLQDGRVTAFNAVQEHDPFCIFEIETVAAREQSVHPGTFTITAIRRSVEPFAGLPGQAGFGLMRASLLSGGGRPSLLYYKTVFHLSDASQPVRALSCMSNQMAAGISFPRHLTPAEIRQALGNLLTLRLPI